jgi:hypothetical protein
MDRAARALCWRPFVRQIGVIDALKLNVAHQIKAFLMQLDGWVGLLCQHSGKRVKSSL